jgi:hypothetical protein
MTPYPLSTILGDVADVSGAIFTNIGDAVNTLTSYPILLVGLLLALSGAIIGVGVRLVKSVRG